MIFITSYKRPMMLLNLLKELKGENVIVYDDGSGFERNDLYFEILSLCDFYHGEHRGKEGFWKTWQDMLEHAYLFKDEDEFIFLQDDLYDIDLKGLRSIETPELFALNVMDIGPDRGWTPFGYVDCNFMTNRKTLEYIGWHIEPVRPTRWYHRPRLSSGVGENLSKMFYLRNVPMILPVNNFASHGDHESKMNGLNRKRNPLIAKTGE